MNEDVRILAIESSCDETACAVVRNGHEVLSNVVATQLELHARYGGVVPEIASRAHVEAVNPVIAEALKQSQTTVDKITAIAVANEPGLIGSLLVGLMAAKTLAWMWQKPIIGVNHVYAHAYSPTLDAEPVQYPAAALVASGGHTALYRCDGPMNITLLGKTIDDAAGEAFDKVASILKLGFPGGPAVDKSAREGNASAVRFPRTLLRGQSLDFSFSGLKTAVLYHVRGTSGGRTQQDVQPRSIEDYSTTEIADIAASFQAAVVDILKIKIRRAVNLTSARTIIVGGGVSANSALRSTLQTQAAKLSCTLRMPELKYCGDNAAMVAGLAYHYFKAGQLANLDLDSRPTIM